jgi:hypothetical protein
MIPKVVEAHYVRDYRIHLRFSDGAEGDVDLGQELQGEILEPLRDISYFRSFSVNPDVHTIVWQNGADFAPEFLYEKLLVSA